MTNHKFELIFDTYDGLHVFATKEVILPFIMEKGQILEIVDRTDINGFVVTDTSYNIQQRFVQVVIEPTEEILGMEDYSHILNEKFITQLQDNGWHIL